MDEYTYGLHDYLRVFGERWRTIAISTVLVFLMAITFTFVRNDGGTSGDTATPPIGTQTATAATRYVLLRSTDVVPVDPEAERLVILSPDILDDPAIRGGPDELSGHVTVQPVGGTVLSITVSDVGGVEEETAEAIANAYLEYRRARIDDSLRASIEVLEAQIRALRDDAEGGGSSIATAFRISALETELAKLESTLARALPGEVIDAPNFQPAAAPSPAATPAPSDNGDEGAPYARNGAAGLVLGAILGAGIALAQDALDRRFRTEDEIERLLQLPVLAVLGADDGGGGNGLGTLAAQIDYAAEERSLSSLSVAGFGDDGGEIRVTERLAARLLDTRPTETVTDQDAPVGLEEMRNEIRGHAGALVLIPTSPARHPSSWLTRAGVADETVVVVDVARDFRAEVVRGKENLERAGASLMGCVVVGRR